MANKISVTQQHINSLKHLPNTRLSYETPKQPAIDEIAHDFIHFSTSCTTHPMSMKLRKVQVQNELTLNTYVISGDFVLKEWIFHKFVHGLIL